MPELPEVECIRRSLEARLVGARVQHVRVSRSDVVRMENGAKRHAKALLDGATIAQLERHGKQLAIIAKDGRTLCVHLGMSGQLRFVVNGAEGITRDHVHCSWEIQPPASRNTLTPNPSDPGKERGIRDASAGGRLMFRDPRRFGGLWTFTSIEQLREARWSRLGPDALSIRAKELACSLGRTRRAIKAALLDQRVIAGVGNIYADEALFMARLHPLMPASELDRPAVTKLVRAVRLVLRQAIKAGGSTLRDYADGNGEAGRYSQQHAVYGRAGQPCRRCGATLMRAVIAQRSTSFCSVCQSLLQTG